MTQSLPLNGSQPSVWHNGTYVDPVSGMNLGPNHLFNQQNAAFQNALQKQNAAEAAEIDVAEVEDRVAENRERNSAMTSLARGMAGSNSALGRGLFQRRQRGLAPNAALGSLATANAASIAAARKKALAAKQAAAGTTFNLGTSALAPVGS